MRVGVDSLVVGVLEVFGGCQRLYIEEVYRVSGVVGVIEVLKGFQWLSMVVEEVSKGCTGLYGF